MSEQTRGEKTREFLNTLKSMFDIHGKETAADFMIKNLPSDQDKIKALIKQMEDVVALIGSGTEYQGTVSFTQLLRDMRNSEKYGDLSTVFFDAHTKLEGNLGASVSQDGSVPPTFGAKSGSSREGPSTPQA